MFSKPKLMAILLLRCPYCLHTPLRKPHAWFEFRSGCPSCRYLYEREPGYFLGAPWMINYPVVAFITLLTTSLFWRPLTAQVGTLGLAAVSASVAIVASLAFYPYARAIWMVGDHWLHPLQERERTDEVTS